MSGWRDGWSRKPLGDGVYRRDEGALLDDFFHVLDQVGVMALLAEGDGVAIQREMVPFGHYVVRYGLKIVCGIERIKALPAWLCSDEALMPLVGCNAQQVRHGVCQRGATKRPGERHPGPSCPDTLAKHIVRLNWRDLEALCKGAMGALAKAGVFGANVTGMADGPDVETTKRSRGGGQVTRQVRSADPRGHVPEVDVTVYGWKVLILIDAATKIPRAVKVGKIEAHETHWTRALGTQARTHRAGGARLHQGVFDQGWLDGSDLGWLDQGCAFIL
jgi:hypothetical protein